MSASFEGLVAVVTGGASGIGAATVDRLRGRGARVASLDLAPADGDRGCLEVACDVTDERSVSDAVAEVVATYGGLDVVVNNAGAGAVGSVEDSDDDTFRRLFEVNVLGAARVTRAALPHLRNSRSPVVVNTSSVAATVGLPKRAAYAASKGALQSLTLAMAADHVAEGIRVCAVAPGTADTPWVRRLLDQASDPAAERTALEARQPSGRLVGAEEVAAAICALASPDSPSATGSVVVIDGGLSSLRLPAAEAAR
ncbi:MAG TPA: SDR family oxidoreductase [Nocardioidaceae bacterium]|nr:SDR family oxidoreductase [Nocardioidaceae bacterium]